MKLQAFHNNPQLKEDMIKEVEKHRKADMILQGTYGEENGKWQGCAVACSLRSLDIIQGEKVKEIYDNHKRYESGLGIPEWLARLEDTLFENLPKEEALKWPTQFIKAINVGADLEPVKWKFSAFLLKENIKRVLSLDIEENLKKQVVDSIQGVLNVCSNAIETGQWDNESAESAESAAWSAAESAARSAAESARSAAGSAWSAAESAAESAAWSETRSIAWLEANKRYAKKLLELLTKEKGK